MEVKVGMLKCNCPTTGEAGFIFRLPGLEFFICRNCYNALRGEMISFALREVVTLSKVINQPKDNTVEFIVDQM